MRNRPITGHKCSAATHQGSTTMPYCPGTHPQLNKNPLLLSSFSWDPPAPFRGPHYHLQSCTLTNHAKAAPSCFKGSLKFPWHGLHSQVTRNCTSFQPTCTGSQGNMHLHHWMSLPSTPSPLWQWPSRDCPLQVTRKNCSRNISSLHNSRSSISSS